ncbi:MAG: diguanylate cyclase response regulator [Syntrophus sp. (in: bacteria)]|nr:diguanylate cyclase response regulator [Syntrophus sp. (in: bacteria)]
MTTDKILIVDDDESNLDLFGTYIDSFGFNYDTAEDGKAAVKKLESGLFTIVLTDIVMPSMDGIQLLKYIREHHPKIGVIVITGYAESFTYTNMIKAGASDFITKPFCADELEAKLNRLVRELSLVRQLELHAVHDALTDLYNRRYFDSRIMAEAQRAERQRYKIFLLMADVDNLKSYNDEVGHQEGDKLLQAMGRILLQSIRKDVDWAFRYGGDEFGVIFIQAELNQIVIIADRIQKEYSQKNFVNTGVSIGIAGFIRHTGSSWEEDVVDLVARADKALYSAKNQGKNRVVTDEAD